MKICSTENMRIAERELIVSGTPARTLMQQASAGIAEADMIYAFRFVFAAATVMLACASVCMILMEERPLAGPSRTEPVDMAE